MWYMEILLIRHGQSQANLEGIVQGNMDSPLSATGIQQARKLQQFLPQTYDHIYSSPLRRALDTALLAMDLAENSPVLTLDPRLEEIGFGGLQGISYKKVPFPREDVKMHLSMVFDKFQEQYGAESLANFFTRTRRAFDDIVTQMVLHQHRRVLVFCHGGVLRSILQHYLQLTSGRFDNTEIARLQLTKMGWQLERLTSHIGPV